ncbi:MAG: nuclear transport factor 2 family protein [Pyrinomonadaceae bacterium]|nr:nuclear transport factor 2 family protein [Pyrinomonadaceae bacterium]
MKKVILVIAILVANSIVFAQKAVNNKSDEKAVKQVIDLFTDGFAHNDIDKLESILAEDYFFSNPGGIVLSREQRLNDQRTGDVVYDSFAIDELKIYFYEKTALANFRTIVKGRNRGKDIAGNYRVTLVLVKKNGKWQIVAQHSTGIPK